MLLQMEEFRSFYGQVTFLGDSVVKNPPANAREAGLIPGSGRSPGGGYSNSLQYSCLENPRGQRSLAGCRPWGHKESEATEQLSLKIESVFRKVKT